MKVLSFVSVIALLLGALTACADPRTAEILPVPELPVVRYVNFRVWDPVYIAIDRGFFEKNGVQVEIVGDVIAGPNAIQAVAGGSAEAGLSSIPALINANAAGLPIQGVIDIQTTLPSQALQRWFVLEDSDIQTIQDVVGRTYAVNIWHSSFHYTSLLKLDEEGIDEKAVKWKLLSFADQIPALLNGKVDVIGLIQPYQNYLLMEHGDKVRELWNDYDLYGTRHVSLIFVNRVWAEYNQDAVIGFTKGIADAIVWTEKNQKEAKAIVARYTGIPENAVPDYHFTERGRVRPDDILAWMDYLKKRGDLTADWVTPEMVGTDRYNQ